MTDFLTLAGEAFPEIYCPFRCVSFLQWLRGKPQNPTLAAFARFTEASTEAASQSTDWSIQHGYIKQVIGRKDRRERSLVLTAKGHSVAAQFEPWDCHAIAAWSRRYGEGSNGLSLTQARILHDAQEKDQWFGDLVLSTGVSSAAITGALDRLCRLGLAARVYGGKDRRKVYATLTGEGRVAAKALDALLAGAHQALR